VTYFERLAEAVVNKWTRQHATRADYAGDLSHLIATELEAVALKAQCEEREACAQIADGTAKLPERPYYPCSQQARDEIAAAIRARGKADAQTP
jgi:hypothetical protein